MAEWQVSLVFQDGSSNKFWRARARGNTLEVNWGRIGTSGQNQVKLYDSPEDCAKEMAKQEHSKRKKGYLDDPDGGTTTATTAPAATAPATLQTMPDRQQSNLVLNMGERKLELRLSVEGSTIRTVAVEHYDSAESARAAFEHLQQAMEAEGYQQL